MILQFVLVSVELVETWVDVKVKEVLVPSEGTVVHEMEDVGKKSAEEGFPLNKTGYMKVSHRNLCDCEVGDHLLQDESMEHDTVYYYDKAVDDRKVEVLTLKVVRMVLNLYYYQQKELDF